MIDQAGVGVTADGVGVTGAGVGVAVGAGVVACVGVMLGEGDPSAEATLTDPKLNRTAATATPTKRRIRLSSPGQHLPI